MRPLGVGLWFEDFEPGRTGETAGKTVTPSDLKFFVAMCNWPRFSNYIVCRVPELLVSMVSVGLVNRMGILEKTLIAVVESHWNYLLPVLVNDTLYVRYAVQEARRTKKGDRGLVVLRLETLNQRKELVAEGSWKLLVRCGGSTDFHGDASA